MIPTLQIGRLALPTGPLLIILGFYLALWLAARVGARRGLAPDHLYNAGFYAALIGLLAGRVGHILRFFPAYRADPASMLSPNLAAFLWPAGVGAGLLMLLWYQRRQRLPALAYADALALGALLLLAAAALADFLNGRHFGEPSLLPWAVTQWGVARHPVQLYELAGIGAAVGLIWRGLPRLLAGETALASLAAAAAVRLGVDAFRAAPLLVGDGFRLSQVIAFTLLILTLLIWYQWRAR